MVAAGFGQVGLGNWLVDCDEPSFGGIPALPVDGRRTGPTVVARRCLGSSCCSLLGSILRIRSATQGKAPSFVGSWWTPEAMAGETGFVLLNGCCNSPTMASHDLRCSSRQHTVDALLVGGEGLGADATNFIPGLFGTDTGDMEAAALGVPANDETAAAGTTLGVIGLAVGVAPGDATAAKDTAFGTAPTTVGVPFGVRTAAPNIDLGVVMAAATALGVVIMDVGVFFGVVAAATTCVFGVESCTMGTLPT